MLVKLNADFTYDWTDFKSIKPNKNLLCEVEKKIKHYAKEKTIPSTESEAQALAELAYKLGTYYLYAKPNPSIALDYLLFAKQFSNGLKLHWLHNHLALCHFYLEEAHLTISYNRATLSSFISAEDFDGLSILAFALWIKALIEFKNNELISAAINSRRATEMFENLGDNDFTFALIKPFYALTMSANFQEFGARNEFEKLNNFWENRYACQSDIASENPYLTVFYVAYASFLENHESKKSELILDLYKNGKASCLSLEKEYLPALMEMILGRTAALELAQAREDSPEIIQERARMALMQMFHEKIKEHQPKLNYDIAGSPVLFPRYNDAKKLAQEERTMLENWSCFNKK